MVVHDPASDSRCCSNWCTSATCGVYSCYMTKLLTPGAAAADARSQRVVSTVATWPSFWPKVLQQLMHERNMWRLLLLHDQLLTPGVAATDARVQLVASNLATWPSFWPQVLQQLMHERNMWSLLLIHDPASDPRCCSSWCTSATCGVYCGRCTWTASVGQSPPQRTEILPLGGSSPTTQSLATYMTTSEKSGRWELLQCNLYRHPILICTFQCFSCALAITVV